MNGDENDSETTAAEVSERPEFDTSVAHIARVYDYWLGGKDNFAADREAAEQALAAFPGMRLAVRANRAFLARTVRYLAGEAGIRQFLDIGTGIPTANNTHEVAQSVAPESRIVYVDNDPVVLNHARALMASTPQGVTAYLDADLRDPEKIMHDASETLDFGQPVAVMLVTILHLIENADDPHGIVTRLMDGVPRDSFLTIAHPASDLSTEAMAEAMRRYNERAAEKATLRTRADVLRFFDGLELLEPGLVREPEWRPESDLEAASPGAVWAGVARKP